ncbi:MAG TPA: DUF4157 domain-containing protein [Opitutaceae bacterium]|nr:DUF4157 domain-containing protein [Opitutaceae bacterium]
MSMLQPVLTKKNETPITPAASGHTGLLQRCSCQKSGSSGPEGEECPECKKKREAGARLQRKAAPAGRAAAAMAPPIVHDVLRSSGRPLDAATRAFMEPRFGYDFSRVRLHTDAQAARSAEAVSAQAYTVGSNIVFGAHRGGPANQRLLAHELAHVVQQGGRHAGGSLTVAPAHDSAEGAADRAADQVLSGGQAAPSTKAAGRLQRMGANPNCTATEVPVIHQGIFDANPWAKKTVSALGASPLTQKTLDALQHHFGTAGTAANAPTIAANLEAGRASMFKQSFACTDATNDKLCAAGNCGDSVAGSGASNICRATLASTDPYFRGGCVLHEAMHASNATMTVDSYSGWQGHAQRTPGYPGATPLINADSYVGLAIELS